MRRKLPADDGEFLAALRRHDWRRDRLAAEIGCTPAAVSNRASALGAPRPPRGRIELLEFWLTDVTARVDALEARPIPPPSVVREIVRVVEWKPNHRRIVDGGEPVRIQRRRNRRKVREASSPPEAATALDWRDQRPGRDGRTKA